MEDYFRRAYGEHDWSVFDEVFSDDVVVTFVDGNGSAEVLPDGSPHTLVGLDLLKVVLEGRIAPLSTAEIRSEVTWLDASEAPASEEDVDDDPRTVRFTWRGRAALEGRPDIAVEEVSAKNVWRFGDDGRVCAVDVQLLDGSQSWHAHQWLASFTALAATEGLELADVLSRRFQPFGTPVAPADDEDVAPDAAARDTIWRAWRVRGVGSATPWFDKEEFPWHASLEAAAGEIRDEFTALSAGQEIPPVVAFRDYNGRKTWRKYVLWFLGVPVESHVATCPRTAALLRDIPGLIGAEFMVLEPQSALPRHNNCILTDFVRCHLGLIVPPDCALSVMDEPRAWEEGRMFMFDDCLPHEAWNRSDERRVILNIDVKRPGIADRGDSEVCAEMVRRVGSLMDADGKFSLSIDGAGTYHCSVPERSLADTLQLPEGETAGADGPLPGVSLALFDRVFRAFYPELDWRER